MRDVTDLAEFRARRDSAIQRRPGESLVDLMRRAEVMAEHPSAFQRHVLDQFAVVDEVHHFTADNPGWDRLWADVVSRSDAIHWVNAPSERLGEVARVLRILRRTDQGSDDGDAEGHQGDDRGA